MPHPLELLPPAAKTLLRAEALSAAALVLSAVRGAGISGGAASLGLFYALHTHAATVRTTGGLPEIEIADQHERLLMAAQAVGDVTLGDKAIAQEIMQRLAAGLEPVPDEAMNAAHGDAMDHAESISDLDVNTPDPRPAANPTTSESN